MQIAFQFGSADTTATCNVEDSAGASAGSGGGTGSFFHSFAFDISGLNAGIDLHFDLYSTTANGSDIDRDKFAPFSHDARTQCCSRTVPEPGTLALIGLGLPGLASQRRRVR